MPGWDGSAARALSVRWLLPCLGMLSDGCMAQELEPRAYSAAPVGTHFLLATYARLGGDVLTDPSLPITDVTAKIDIFALGYLQVFNLLGRTSSVGVVLPYSRANVTGNVFDAPNSVYRAGIGDAYLRFAVNLLGGAARTPAEFARHPPVPSLGTSLTVVTPSGQYHADRLINIGANRWAFKPEVGVSAPFGNWFAEGSFGVWFFTANDEFLGSRQRQQSPLAVVQLHGGYQFRPGLWLAADAGFYSGGSTTVDGVRNDDRRTNTRYGLTLSVPFAANWSGKISASKGWITRAGGDYKAISLTVQYRWID